jgi:hypothetical protein
MGAIISEWVGGIVGIRIGGLGGTGRSLRHSGGKAVLPERVLADRTLRPGLAVIGSEGVGHSP